MKHHPWIARFVIAIAMLLISFVGLILTDIRDTGGWNYWRVSALIYAVLALWLSWYLRHQKASLSPVTLWHELLHWAGLIGSVFLVTYYVHLGILGRFEAGLFVLTLLALSVFIAGVYIEPTFLWIGLFLGLFSGGVAFFEEYLYAFALIGLLAIGIALVGWLWWKRHHPKISLPADQKEKRD